MPEVRLSSRVLDAVVPPDSPLVGRALIKLGLPRGVLFVQIRREDDAILPDGATLIEPDDHLLIRVRPEAQGALDELRDRAALRLIGPAQGSIGTP